MTSNEIRQKFLDFFEKRGHKIIPSASLIPENDPSVLFTTAGMQPLVPYLLGEEHPAGKRIANIQKCVRTQDIEEVGDATHNTFFEMMGNWSLGDYFKEESIAWSYELLTDKKEGFGLDPERIYVTCFEGDGNAPQDVESAEIWKSAGIPENRIYFLGAKDNWWSPGDNGPCGPDTEIFYDMTETGLGDLSKEEFIKAQDVDQSVVEIWNNVFMEYEKKDGKVIGKLKQKNVDTGAGFERFVMALQKKDNVFDTDLFEPIMNNINQQSSVDLTRPKRIVADHLRTAIFMISDGVTPSNTDRGYVLRRLIRRAFRHGEQVGIEKLTDIIPVIINVYGDLYGLKKKKPAIDQVITEEITKFEIAISDGLKKIEKILAKKVSINDDKFVVLMNDTQFLLKTMFNNRRNKKPFSIDEIPLSEKEIEQALVTGREAFDIYQTFGLPIEVVRELVQKRNLLVDGGGYREELKKHQELSRAGAEQKFKGGLAGHGEKELQYHTATHLLHQALRDVLGDGVEQKGSNITADRLRFDFSYPEKMTDEQKSEVENIVNEKIKAGLCVQKIVLPIEEAKKTGAIHFFNEKYGDEVSVYFVGENIESAYSKEFCGGPHVENTNELKGEFKIKKEESVSAGTRRIKAVLR